MSEIDKTIEELEAEVSQELEEAQHDVAKKGAAKGDSMKKVDGEVQDLGPAVDEPQDKDKGSAKAGEKVKKAADPKAKKIAAGYDNMKPKANEEVTKEDVEKDEKEESTLDSRLASIDVSEDVDALMNGQDLSEEFKNKAKTIFEAAVKSKIRSEVERIEEESKKETETQMESFKSDLTEKVDNYLNYVVEQWLKDNELAIERGLKGEIAEDFISGLKTLFEEHYIDVPNEKYDVLESQSEKIDELEKKLNEQVEKNAELNGKVSGMVRDSLIAEVSADLVDTEVEKFKELAKDAEFTTEESFKEKLETLKESYFPKKKVVSESVDSESDSSEVESKEVSGSMASYLAAITKTKNIKV
tara:strand:- start:181 stop:1254 length:1074 start_codon:yes stop_codon:yes gene_type:complete